MEANQIAVRLYANQKLGSTYAKGLYHTAVFNAAADVLGKNTKYLLDYHTYDRWQHTAKSDEQMEVLDCVSEHATEATLVSWVVRYDAATKKKTPVIGYSTLNAETNELELVVLDTVADMCAKWQLTAKPCRTVPGKNSPTLLATNAEDLAMWG